MQGDLKMHLEKKEESEEMWKEMLLGAQLEMHSWNKLLYGRGIRL